MNDGAANVSQMEAMLRTKSVHSLVEPDVDGLRLLVARHRGHGLPKTAYDVWVASLGPSEELLRAFQAGEVEWPEFARRYKTEILDADGNGDGMNRTIKNHGQKFTLRLLQALASSGNVTLLCHCAEEQTHCHRHLLKKLIDSV